RRVLSAGAGEHRDLLHDDRRKERGSGPSETRRRVHDPDDERGLGDLRDVQGSGRERVLSDRGVKPVAQLMRLGSIIESWRWNRTVRGLRWNAVLPPRSGSPRPPPWSRSWGAGGAARSPS